MSDKYLLLQFRNAKFFPLSAKGNFKTKDKTYDIIQGKQERLNMEFYDEPITLSHISNVLHVLFGQRPVSSFRYSSYQADEYLLNKAKDSFLRIDTPKLDKDKYHVEQIQLNKAGYNTWNRTITVYWGKIKLILGEERYKGFLKLLKKHYQITPINTTFNEVLPRFTIVNEKMKVWNYGSKKDRTVDVPADLHEDFLAFYKIIGDEGLTSFIKLLHGNLPDINKIIGKCAQTTFRGVGEISILSGSILVPVTNSDLKALYNATATILDGGLVHIQRIIDEEDLDEELFNDFIQVSEISTNKSFKTYESKDQTNTDQPDTTNS